MKKLIFLLLSCYSISVHAQQDVHFSMFWNAYNVFNPAFSGLTHQHFGTLTYRNQWDGVPGAPNSVLATYNAKVNKLHGGLGVNYLYDHIGFTKTHDANVTYSYHLQVGDSGTLAFGVAAGITHLSMNPEWIPPTSNYDPLLPGKTRDINFNMNLGVMYRYRNLLIGISSTSVTKPELKLKNWNYTKERHYYLTGAYAFQLGSRFELKPQAMMQTDAVQINWDFNLMATYNRRFWLGVSFETGGTTGSVMAGWDIRERFRIGYLYEKSWNVLENISKGTHEAVLGILIR